jgi:excisionase family DNA binding protein
MRPAKERNWTRTDVLMADVALLTAGDVAAILGVPKSWVYAQSREGRLPTVRLGRYYRYRRAAIAAWLAEQER